MIQSNLLPVSDMVPAHRVEKIPGTLQRGRFFLNPVFAMQSYLQQDLPRLAALGVDGLELRWAGELVLQDANLRHPLQRSEFASAWRQMLQTVAAEMGAVAAQGGNEYVLGVAEAVTRFPLYHHDHTFGDVTVPFYPLATHGLVRIYPEPANLHTNLETAFLKQLEYGMLPVYELTYRDPLLLARTTYPKLYSSRYLDWLPRAAAEYEVIINQLGPYRRPVYRRPQTAGPPGLRNALRGRHPCHRQLRRPRLRAGRPARRKPGLSHSSRRMTVDE